MSDLKKTLASSACGSYGACINESNGFLLALSLLAFTGTFFVVSA